MVQWLGLHTCRGPDLFPGWGTKILQTARPLKERERERERELLSHQDKYYFNVIFLKFKISARKRIHDKILKKIGSVIVLF